MTDVQFLQKNRHVGTPENNYFQTGIASVGFSLMLYTSPKERQNPGQEKDYRKYLTAAGAVITEDDSDEHIKKCYQLFSHLDCGGWTVRVDREREDSALERKSI